jgi:hypothetical protein
MSNILIGSSNIARFYKAESFSKFRPYTLSRCTEFSSFQAIMDESTEKYFVISVLENFVSNRVKSEKDNSLKIIESVTQEFLEVIRSSATRLPDSKFAVVMPLQRPALDWYQDSLQELRSYVEDGLLGMKMDNVTKIDCISTITQQFAEDQVHLTEASGKSFLDFIFGQSETFFKSIQVDLSEDDASGEGTTSSLALRLTQLEAAFRNRSLSDNMVLARLREEIDSGANRSKEDRIVINGLVCRKPLPSEIRAKTALLSEVAMEIFKFLVPSFKGKITFISQGKGAAGILPMVEVLKKSIDYGLFFSLVLEDS